MKKQNHYNKGFTLAETLIVLVIIGVIAAVTIPSVVAKYQKLTVETKLKKFYSSMNNAIRLSQTENEDSKDWIKMKHDYTYNETKTFLETYILPHLNYIEITPCNSPNNGGAACVKLLDGSVFLWATDFNGSDIVYYTKYNDKSSWNDIKTAFWFQFHKYAQLSEGEIKSEDSIQPYIYDWDGTIQNLKNDNIFGCYNKNSRWKTYCAKLIKLNNWKIPDDYPW